MQFPDLASLPPWAVVAFGISLAVIVAFTWFGLERGRKSAPAASQATAQVAAMIVDPTAINHATASVEGLTVVLTQLVAVGRDHARNMERMAEEMDKVREEMRIQREVSRR